MKKIEKKMTAKQKAMWFRAVRNSDIDTIERMIAEGIDVNITTTPNRWTALYYACFCKHADMIKLLLDNGADVNIRNDNLRTPLHLACAYGQIDIAKFLIENNADINAQNNTLNTPLHVACYWENIEIVKLLINNDADVAMTDTYGDTPIGYLKRNNPQKYEELTGWLSENHPDKALEYMAKENSPSKGVEI